MSKMVFCNQENDAFDASNFAVVRDGLTIHVITKTEGHTLDGWKACYDAKRTDKVTWALSNVKICDPEIHNFPEMTT